MTFQPVGFAVWAKKMQTTWKKGGDRPERQEQKDMYRTRVTLDINFDTGAQNTPENRPAISYNEKTIGVLVGWGTRGGEK